MAQSKVYISFDGDLISSYWGGKKKETDGMVKQTHYPAGSVIRYSCGCASMTTIDASAMGNDSPASGKPAYSMRNCSMASSYFADSLGDLWGSPSAAEMIRRISYDSAYYTPMSIYTEMCNDPKLSAIRMENMATAVLLEISRALNDELTSSLMILNPNWMRNYNILLEAMNTDLAAVYIQIEGQLLFPKSLWLSKDGVVVTEHNGEEWTGIDPADLDRFGVCSTGKGVEAYSILGHSSIVDIMQ